MDVRINQQQAAAFVQHALNRAVPGVAFAVKALPGEGGAPALAAEWTDQRTGQRGQATFRLPPAATGDWDAAALVDAAVEYFTAPFATPLRRRRRAA